MKTVVLAPDQTNVDVPATYRAAAIDAAFRVTMSPHEWTWTQEETQHMARYVLWAHQRLSGIAQLATGELTR